MGKSDLPTQEIKDTIERWQRISQRLSDLSNIRDSEIRVEEKVRLDAIIDELRRLRDAVSARIDALEGQRASSPCSAFAAMRPIK